MRVFIIRGAFGEVYEPSWQRALFELGNVVYLFDSHQYTSKGIIGRIERKFLIGWGIRRIRKLSIIKAMCFKPDVILLYQGHYHNKKSIEQLKKIAWVTGYHNDNPFSALQDGRHKTRYKNLIKALKAYDSFHVYRSSNIIDMKNAGIQNVELLMSYYVPWLDKKPDLYDETYECDVIFAGHPEKDGREVYINALLELDIKVNIYGDEKYWLPLIDKRFRSRINRIKVLNPIEYRKALFASKICLSFFSYWNRDDYTRRVFEIPALGKFLMTQRTQKMLDLYKEDKEAVYFENVDELLTKVIFYLKNSDLREEIASNGKVRCLSSGYDIHSRMQQWILNIQKWQDLKKEK